MPANAAVTIGQLASGTPLTSCNTMNDWIQPTVTSGNTYVSPVAGTVTSWSHNAAAGADQKLTMKVFRKVADVNVYMVVGHDGPRDLTGGGLNTFPANIQVKVGDVLGLNSENAPTINNACQFLTVPSERVLWRPGNMTDGQTEGFFFDTGTRTNVIAVVDPTNTFTFGATTRNKRKGTATLNLTLPNPGELVASGKGVKASSSGAAVTSKSVGAGSAKLLIKAKGKAAKTLNETGAVKVKPKITYTPSGGSPRTESRKLKLRKKL